MHTTRAQGTGRQETSSHRWRRRRRALGPWSAGLVALATVALGGVAACGSDDGGATSTGTGVPTTSSAAGDTLAGRSFVSIEVTGQDLVAGSVITAAFDDGMISLNAGCNSMGGSYELDGDTLVVADLMSTMMGCEEALMAQDTWVSELFGSSPTVELEAERLTVTGQGTTIVFTAADPEPDQSLVGTAWTLETIVEGAVASSVPGGVAPPTLTFGEDGFVEVFAGCNRGRAAYGFATADDGGDLVSLGGLALTELACDEAAMDLEATVAEVLGEPAPFAIDGAVLTLGTPEQSLVYRAG